MIRFNDHPHYGTPLPTRYTRWFKESALQDFNAYLDLIGDARPTPLIQLDNLAEKLKVESIQIKDEGHRFGLGSFKALGGAYAVVKILTEEATRRLGKPISLRETDTKEVRTIATDMTMVCATDGNHGISVAYGARLIGARAILFVHSGVSTKRIATLEQLGAQVCKIQGTYDESVAIAHTQSKKNGWYLVSDTSWANYERIPGFVMQGYTQIIREVLPLMKKPPTHVFVQAGVGGLAAAATAYLSIRLPKDRPKIIIVEPSRAACLYESMEQGQLTTTNPYEPTVMAMLECYKPSLTAWNILSYLADAFLKVEEHHAITAMNLLARPPEGDKAIVAGESGSAGFAGFLAAHENRDIASALGLDAQSRVFAINTEGATDPDIYKHLVGIYPDHAVRVLTQNKMPL